MPSFVSSLPVRGSSSVRSSSVLSVRGAPAPLRRPAVLRCNAVAQTTTKVAEAAHVEELVPEPTAPAPASNALTRDAFTDLSRKAEAKAKALIALEEVQAANRPTLRLSLRRQIGLGEAWKITGNCPELGMMNPRVAPAMKWSSGDVWTLDTPIRAGNHTYKAVLRRADGAYIWEAGEDRSLEVPSDLGKDDSLAVELDVKLPY